MSIFGKILDIFGQGDKSFYARDFRNAYTLRPDQNPPRQQFQGYVSFVLNRSLYEEFYNDSSYFRTQIGSLVRRASLPEVTFKTETKNQYNKKKIINTGVEYSPINITVLDTVNNEWLTLLMKYYSYHYMNGRNEEYFDRDLGGDPTAYLSEQIYAGSKFGSKGWTSSGFDSNKSGYNINVAPYFFERIDMVLYHGNRGVQYSMLRPVLTSFKTGEIDYSSSDLMNFDLTFEYESFTTYSGMNFKLSDFDIGRFEKADGFKGAAFVPDGQPLILKDDAPDVRLDILGNQIVERTRSLQPQPEAPGETDQGQPDSSETSNTSQDTGAAPDPKAVADSATKSSNTTATQNTEGTGTQNNPAVEGDETESPKENKLPSTYGNTATFANPTGKSKSFLGNLLGNVADAAISTAINGGSIKNAVITSALGTTLNELNPKLKQLNTDIRTRPQKTSVAESSSPAQKNEPAEPGG